MSLPSGSWKNMNKKCERHDKVIFAKKKEQNGYIKSRIFMTKYFLSKNIQPYGYITM